MVITGPFPPGKQRIAPGPPPALPTIAPEEVSEGEIELSSEIRLEFQSVGPRMCGIDSWNEDSSRGICIDRDTDGYRIPALSSFLHQSHGVDTVKV